MKTQKAVNTGILENFLGAFTGKPAAQNTSVISNTSKQEKSQVSLDIRDLKLIPLERLILEKHSCERDSYLMLAVKNNNLEAFEHLVKQNAFDLLYKNASGYTVVHLIVKQNLPDFFDMLYKNSGKTLMGVYNSLDSQTNKGLTPLHLAIENNNEIFCRKIIDLLEKRNAMAGLKNGPKTLKENLEIFCSIKETALLKAVRIKNENIAKLLIEKGSDIYAVNKEKRNILHIAIQNKMKDFIKFLITYDADKNLLREGKDIKGRKPKEMDTEKLFGQMLIHVWDLCSSNKNIYQIRGLFDREGKTIFEQKTRIKGNTALHIAVVNNCDEIVSLLIEDFNINPNIQNTKGQTPLDLAKSLLNKAKKPDKKPDPRTLKILKILGENISEYTANTKQKSAAEIRIETLIKKMRDKIEKQKIPLDKLFSKLDKDKNGVLSPSEIECLFICLNIGIQSKEVRELICYADLNKDGMIQYSEFLKMVMPQPEEEKNNENPPGAENVPSEPKADVSQNLLEKIDEKQEKAENDIQKIENATQKVENEEEKLIGDKIVKSDEIEGTEYKIQQENHDQKLDQNEEKVEIIEVNDSP